MTPPSIAEGMATVTREDWIAAVTADLGPDAVARQLRFTSEDGVSLDALQTEPGPGAGVGVAVARLVARARAAHSFPQALGVRQRVDAAGSPVAQVVDAISGGADSVELDFERLDPGAVEAKLGVLAAPVLEAGRELALRAWPPAALDAVLGALFPLGAAFSAGIDPITALSSGDANRESPADLLVRIAPYAAEGGRGRLLRASSEPWFDAGATVGWGLALAIAAGLEYVRALEQHGVSRAGAARQVELEVALGSDLFEGIAAVRAARLVWARVLEVTGGDPETPLQLAATSGTRQLSRRDPWTNALRGTAVASSAAIGGADLVRLPAFDERVGASPAAWRLARNTPLVLREEAGLARVVDPAGGSWYLDAATGQLAERVWTMLGEIDAAGGVVAAVTSGFVKARLQEQRLRRDAAIRRRERSITGVTEFPDRSVRAPGVVAPGARTPSRPSVQADAEPFERLQDAADSYAATHRGRAKLLLVRLGPAAESATRAKFTRGIVELGGMDVVSLPGIAAPEHAARSLEASGARVAILCGTDARYGSEAAPLAAALKQAGARLVLVSGSPGTHAEALRAQGVDDFVHVGSDVTVVIERLLRAAGVLP